MPEPVTLEQIQQKLCAEIESLLSLKPGAVAADTALQSLGMDSLKFVSLLIAIEQKFGVNLMKLGIKRTDLQSVSTLSTVIKSGQK